MSHFWGVRNDQGYWVGIWNDVTIAEGIVARSQPSHHETLVKLVQPVDLSNIWVVARETVIEIEGQERPKLGYTLFEGAETFGSFEQASDWIDKKMLTIGWVAMRMTQLLPTLRVDQE